MRRLMTPPLVLTTVATAPGLALQGRAARAIAAQARAAARQEVRR